MTIPFYDKLITRGYALFESLNIINEQFEQIEKHMKRLEQSSEDTGIALPFPIDAL